MVSSCSRPCLKFNAAGASRRRLLHREPRPDCFGSNDTNIVVESPPADAGASAGQDVCERACEEWLRWGFACEATARGCGRLHRSAPRRPPAPGQARGTRRTQHLALCDCVSSLDRRAAPALRPAAAHRARTGHAARGHVTFARCPGNRVLRSKPHVSPLQEALRDDAGPIRGAGRSRRPDDGRSFMRCSAPRQGHPPFATAGQAAC